MIGHPAGAPPRPDLGFLRHRARPAAAASAGPRSSATSAGTGAFSARTGASADTRSDAEIRAAIADFVNGRTRHPGRASAPATPAAGPAISFDRPGRASGPATDHPTATGGAISFDRPGRSHGVPPVTPSRPAADRETPAAAAPGSSRVSFDRPGRHPNASSSSLDLDATSSPQRASTNAGSLDLSESPVGTGTRRRVPTSSARRPPAGLRLHAGQQQLLGPADPAVVLTRVQSGVGTLSIEAVCGPDVGDLRLGAAYHLRGGATSIVQLADNGNRFAPSSRRPVVVAGRDEYEHLRVDLRQVRDLERMSVYAFSESRGELRWGGTLVIGTFGGARIDLPLETLTAGRIAVLVSIYVVDGELLVRTEMETVDGDVREAARAYGYDRITWRDDRHPID